jgi:hypothetical protein
MTDALHGDGINFAFFNLLWSKSDGGTKTKEVADRQGGVKPAILRVPDTVVFLFGQPHQWYFTSKNGGPNKDKTTILRKRRGNLTLANIEEVFLTKSASRELGEDDVVAYFISSNGDGDGTEQLVNLEVGDAFTNNDAPPCTIEYLNQSALKEFLQHGRTNKSGILQRFIAPHGGGRHNSQIRAIWTPKLCILERRQTKQELDDTRFALYERCITFDGPDVHSVSVPLRGTVLAGQVEHICKDIVEHLANVAAENAKTASKSVTSASKKCNDNSFVRVARMVVNFKVDGNGKIWILWSNSIRLESVALENPDQHSSTRKSPLSPLNMETVVKLPSSVKLTQAPNHNANMTLENKLLTATCPSCNRIDVNPHFQPVPYRTVIQHFEKTLKMLEDDASSHPSKVWPPDDRFIIAVGNVGFGSLEGQIARDRKANPTRKYTEETRTIPPVIREIHPSLRVKGYAVYRNDPTFLLKTANVCETCFLSYAELTVTSFVQLSKRIIDPGGCEEEIKGAHYNYPDSVNNTKPRDEGRKKIVKASVGNTDRNEFDSVQPPELPPPIEMPPPINESATELQTDNIPTSIDRDLENARRKTYFPPSADYAKKNLEHLIVSHKMLSEAAKGPSKLRAVGTKNPYTKNLEKKMAL